MTGSGYEYTRLYDGIGIRVQLGFSFIPQRNEKSNNQFLKKSNLLTNLLQY